MEIDYLAQPCIELMHIAGSLADGVRVYRLDGCRSDAIANRESRSKRHTLGDANLRANAAANNRAIANLNDCSFNHCFASYLNACSRERDPDSHPRRSLRRHAEPR